MLSAFNRMLRIVLAQAAREESIAAVLTVEWNNPDQRRDMLARRLWTRAKHAGLSALWTGHLAAHSALLSVTWGSTHSLTAL